MDRVIAAKVFVSIVEQGSLIAAADSLEMSRSMVTRYLNTMEDWAGARLLHRSTRRLSLSPAGEHSLLQCRALLEVAQQLATGFESEDTQLQGSLRIACSLSFGQDVLMQVFKDFLLSYPKVDVDLHVGNQAVNLIKERIDLAIRITNDLDPNLIARKLGDCHSVICAAPEYLQQHGTPKSIEELSEHNCLTYSHFGKSLWSFLHRSEPVSVAVSGNLTANDPSLILEGALQGMGVVLQPKFSVTKYIESGELVPVLTQYQPQKLGIYGLYSSRQHMSKVLRSMLDALIEHLAQASI